MTAPAFRRVVDLSHPVDDSTPVYPGDPEPAFTPATTIAEHGYNVLHVRMGSQTGTHLDAPYHFLADGARVEDLDPALLCAPGVIVDVRGKRPRTAITWGDLEPRADELGPGMILVLHTGWSEHWGTDAYADHPYLDADAARRIVETGVRTVAIDAMSLDETTDAEEHPTGFAAHHAVLGAGGVIAENLTGLAAVDFDSPVVSLLPILLRGADGAPVRAVAMERSDAPAAPPEGSHDRDVAAVLGTAADLVSAFGDHRVEDYFGFFAVDATFVFHHVPERLDSRGAYESLWRTWEDEDGFQVLSCESSDAAVQVLGDVAIFRHDVRTTARLGGEEDTLEERESIVFARRDGRWVAVHEHLSPRPPVGAGP